MRLTKIINGTGITKNTGIMACANYHKLNQNQWLRSFSTTKVIDDSSNFTDGSEKSTKGKVIDESDNTKGKIIDESDNTKGKVIDESDNSLSKKIWKYISGNNRERKDENNKDGEQKIKNISFVKIDGYDFIEPQLFDEVPTLKKYIKLRDDGCITDRIYRFLFIAANYKLIAERKKLDSVYMYNSLYGYDIDLRNRGTAKYQIDKGISSCISELMRSRDNVSSETEIIKMCSSVLKFSDSLWKLNVQK